MELRQLRYFVAVADTLNFSRASESLYVSQSALSKQIADLEQELGVRLFQRDKRTVELSCAGRLLLGEAKAILLRSEKLVPLLQEKDQQSQQERTIYIGVETRAEQSPQIHHVLAEIVYQKRQNMPGLQAVFQSRDYVELKKALLDDELDLGLFLVRNGKREADWKPAYCMKTRSARFSFAEGLYCWKRNFAECPRLCIFWTSLEARRRYGFVKTEPR
ncbi:MAG: LysR family transcriptional regulator [Eubacterium sp.]|mgnify:CR=1 FL=1|nr:LysR family transcriptional regulator [Eubacterium sp.]